MKTSSARTRPARFDTKLSFALFALLISGITAVLPAKAGTLVVTNTNDSGPGSLRQAIADANKDAQPDTILFQIPASDPGYNASTKVYFLQLTSGEVAITTPMTVDGANSRIRVFRDVYSPSFRLFNVSGSGVTLTNLYLTGGRAVGADGSSQPGAGGSVFNNGALTLLNCSFGNNSARGGTGISQLAQGGPGGDGLGGAVYNAGTLAVTNCTLFANVAAGGDGGTGSSSIGISGRGGNGGSGRGGAIFSESGTLTVTNCSVGFGSTFGGRGGTGDGGNGASGGGIGGGIAVASGNAALRNSIVSNTAPEGSEVSGTLSTSTNIIGGDAFPAGFGYNGGSTPTLELIAGSAAINAGNDAFAPPTDQRGYARFGVSDIGAFEFGTPGQLLNLSTRKQVGTGDNVTIAGFIVVGTEAKKVILRGLGPSLPVGGALADPTLELHDAAGNILAVNNNWQDTQPDAIKATGIPPSDNLESAIVKDLPASSDGTAYTGVLAGRSGGTGIGLLDLYDLNTAASAKLANISTRGFVGTGDDVLIGGFIPGPSDRAPLKIIIRGLGASLPVSGALQDPVVELHDADGNTLVTNDNWQEASNAADIQDSGIAPTDGREAAILITLLPSNGYTAVLRGVNNTTGIALVDLYALQ